MTKSSWLWPRRFELGCTVEVSHCFESLGANVDFDEAVNIRPGDRVEVHGEPIHVPYGERIRERRRATLVRAPRWEQAWVRATGDRECLELLDVSFTHTPMTGRGETP